VALSAAEGETSAARATLAVADARVAGKAPPIGIAPFLATPIILISFPFLS
jgi:hypothetical protein